MRPRLLALLLSISAAGAVASVAACEDIPFYVYSAQKWNVDGACLEAYVPVDVVQGSGADSSCPAACLMIGKDLYVSTVCPPLPANATAVAATDPACKAALEAARRGDACDAADAAGEGGGEGGGGDDAEAGGEDAAADAPEDAPEDVRDARADG
jgi:hypothetical protein